MLLFEGVRIIDVTKVFSGPYATRLFADYGAEVIKIENEASPDDSRFFPPLKSGWSGYYEILNRNKSAISLDLKNEEKRKILYELVASSDVFVENLSPQTKYRLKIDYETLKKINPTIVYASLSGLGKNSDRKYYDVIAQAESGLMSLTGTELNPMKIGPSVVDAFSGVNLAFAIASALYAREKTKQGQEITVSMKGVSMNLLESNLISYSMNHLIPERTGNHDNLIAPFGVYNTYDKPVVLAIGSDALWKQFCDCFPDSTALKNIAYNTNQGRIDNLNSLIADIETEFRNLTSQDVLAVLATKGVPCAPINSMEDVSVDEDNFSRQFLYKIQHPMLGECIVPGTGIHFSMQPRILYTNAPKIGENNRDYGL